MEALESLISDEELSAKRTTTRENAEDSNQRRSQRKPRHVQRTLSGPFRTPENNSRASSLISTKGELVNALIKRESDAPAGSNAQPKKPAAKIPKVPKMLREIESNKDCYDPKVVSIGPYHHGKPQLQEIESLKIELAKQFVKDFSEEQILALYYEVEGVAMEARGYYDCHEMEAEKFAIMMFLDGCFILQFIYLIIASERRTKLGMKSHQVAFVQRDLLLLENQLPYIVLEALMNTRFKNAGEGKKMIHEFIELIKSHPPEPRSWFKFPFGSSSKPPAKSPGDIEAGTEEGSNKHHVHLLDLVRENLVNQASVNAKRKKEFLKN